MPRLKDNIYKITTTMNITNTSTPHDIKIIGYGII
jgi:hypothetical protein